MTCYNPTTIYILENYNQDGSITRKSYAYDYEKKCKPTIVPCKKCIGCRYDKSREWGLRATLESYYHKEAMFLTLTYNDENLPKNRSLKKADMQLFNKRLREWLVRNYGKDKKIRNIYCGEYGKKLERPHYHSIIYGWRANDMIFLKKTSSGDNLYKSKILNKLWGKGWVTIGKVTQESCNYVAQYCTKKEKKLDEKYIVEKANGIIEVREPEFIQASTRRGIAYKYLTKHQDRLVNTGIIKIQGREYPVPNYIKKIIDPLKIDTLSVSRIENAKERPQLTKEQLIKKELNHKRRIESREKNLTSNIDIR